MDFYKFSKKMNDWRYECAKDISRLDDEDFFEKSKAYLCLEVPSWDVSGAFGKLCGAIVSYSTNFVPLRTSIEYVDLDIDNRGLYVG